MRIKRYEVPFGISDEKVRLASLAQNDTKTTFGSNANLILRRFARRASFEATSAPANAKRTPFGVDLCAAEYAKKHKLKLTEFLPQYELYGRAAPIVRNKNIVDYSDKVIIFWNGSSRGTQSVIKYAKKIGKPLEVVFCN